MKNKRPIPEEVNPTVWEAGTMSNRCFNFGDLVFLLPQSIPMLENLVTQNVYQIIQKAQAIKIGELAQSFDIQQDIIKSEMRSVDQIIEALKAQETDQMQIRSREFQQNNRNISHTQTNQTTLNNRANKQHKDSIHRQNYQNNSHKDSRQSLSNHQTRHEKNSAFNLGGTQIKQHSYLCHNSQLQITSQAIIYKEQRKKEPQQKEEEEEVCLLTDDDYWYKQRKSKVNGKHL